MWKETWASLPGPEAVSGSGATGRPMDGVAVLIPALDEEASLPGVLKELRRQGVDRVVVVDNGSTDGTARVVRENGARVILERRRGYGAACLAGIADLAADPPGILVFMDGDHSDDPSDLPELVRPIHGGEADLVIGVRTGVGGGGSQAVPWHARVGNRVVRAGMRWLHGLRASDMGPFRAVRFTALMAMEMDDRNWGWTLQMQLRAHHLGMAVVEVPVSHHPRVAGRSKVSGSFTGSAAAGGKMLLTLVTERWRMERRTKAT